MTNNPIYSNLTYVTLLVRLCIPPIILVSPILALSASLLADGFDGQIYFTAGFPWYAYQRIDKLLDYWWYLWILFFFWGHPLFGVAALLFLYRSVGQWYGIIANRSTQFIFFPNILEWFFLGVILWPFLSPWLLLGMSVAWSLFVEWLIHYSKLHIVSKHMFHHEIRWEKNANNIQTGFLSYARKK